MELQQVGLYSQMTYPITTLVIKRFWVLHVISSLVHFVTAITVAVYAFDLPAVHMTSCYAFASETDEHYIHSLTPKCEDRGTLKIQVLIITEGLWTACAHAFYAFDTRKYVGWVDAGLVCHWLEYAVSVPFVFVSALVLSGVTSQPLLAVTAMLLVSQFAYLLGNSPTTSLWTMLSGCITDAAMYVGIVLPFALQASRQTLPKVVIALFAFVCVFHNLTIIANRVLLWGGYTNRTIAKVLCCINIVNKSVLRSLFIVAISK
jgi:hypothetical protein